MERSDLRVEREIPVTVTIPIPVTVMIPVMIPIKGKGLGWDQIQAFLLFLLSLWSHLSLSFVSSVGRSPSAQTEKTQRF